MTSSEASNKGQGGARKYAYNREGARERETHLYLPYWGFSGSEKFAQQSQGHRPNVSRDNVLTVFAQLATLRMNAQRALISLFDKTSQHVVAEATPNLGLRGAEIAGGDRSDALWLGVQQFPREEITMCYHAMRSFVEENADIFVAGDLTRDDRFKNHPSVTGHPHNRFYVSVPIISPDDYVIGSMAILDDKPRDGVIPDEKQLCQELSATIMDHLLSQRAMREEYREEKMVRALGLFVKGKSDLDEWFYSREAPDKRYGGQIAHVNERLEGLQVSGDDDNEAAGEDSKEEKPKQYSAPDTGAKPDQEKNISPVQRYKRDSESGGETDQDEEETDETKSGGREKNQKKSRPRLSPQTSQLQESLAPANVRSVVNRAASMIYQALDVEGAMFIDASVYTRRQLETVGSTDSNSKSDGPENYDVHQQQAPKGSRGDRESGDFEKLDTGCKTGTFEDDSEEARSIVLGHYTSSTSKKGVNQRDNHYVSLSGGFVSHLIDQYPRGRIFHLEEDGSISLSYEGTADEMNDSQTENPGPVSAEPKNQDVEQETMDVKRLTKVLPDARCIAFYPVWDFQRGRWFSVCVVWTNDPGRVLSEPKDLTYLAAFSNTVMAEVSRLDLEAADRAKSDFISSISHELRSPLHGLLGTVELLQEMVNSYAQRSLVETVYSCGRTLLDTLNHLLDYAKINTLTESARSTTRGVTDSFDSKGSVSGSSQDEDLSVLVQEVVEGILAGAEYQRWGANRDQNTSHKQKEGNSDSRLLTIIDIEWRDSWQFSMYTGAWRRVVMNLFGNALKYTENGYVRLMMQNDTLLIDGHERPAVRLTVSDSGRGMSKDFLANHLYSAFLQEDTTSPGLGVGLHLVHQIVKSLKGTIQFNSELGKGTSVDVVLPIESPTQSPNPTPSPFGSLKEKLNGKTVSLFTRSWKQGNLGLEPRVFDTLLTSLAKMISGWFGLRVLTADELGDTKPDFAIVTEHEYRHYYREGSNEPTEDSAAIQPAFPLIVLSSGTGSWEALRDTVEDSVIFLTQPVSPKTLLAAFNHCFGGGDQSRGSSPKKSPRMLEGRKRDGRKQDAGRFESIKEGDVESTANGASAKGKIDRGASAQQRADNPKQSEKKILIVDDNQVNLKIVEMCVKQAGFANASAKNGLEALEQFKRAKYDLVVMDISMPVMDGLTATREMRQFEQMTKRPRATIIILTAALSASMQREAMLSGVDLFLTKPTPLKKLKEILRGVSEGRDVKQD